MFHCQPEMCRLLINEGADLSYIDHQGNSVLDFIAITFEVGPRGSSHEEFVGNCGELIRIAGPVMPQDDAERQELEQTIVNKLESSPFVRAVLLGGLTHVRQLAPEIRAKMVVKCGSLDLIVDLTSSDLSVQQAFSTECPDLYRIGLILQQIRKDLNTKRCLCDQVCHEMIAFEHDRILRGSRCPPDWIIVSLGSSSDPMYLMEEEELQHYATPEVMNRSLRDWLSYLESNGADLKLFSDVDLCECRTSLKECNFFWNKSGWKLIGLDTGPMPADWRLWVAADGWEYEWAGEFWKWIENPEMFMPGAFLGEEDW